MEKREESNKGNFKYNYKILNEANKEVEIRYKNKKLRFKLKVKRAFTVLKVLLKVYPEYRNIHDLDSVLHDPNRAHSDLRIADGFASFLDEKKGKSRVNYLRLNVERLFKYCRVDDPNKFTSLSAVYGRESFSENLKEEIYKKFKGRCNITGIKLCKNPPKDKIFMKNFMLSTYDHRRPLSKNGSNEKFNLQLISKAVNDEKNKICNICSIVKCEQCALAYPENFKIILPTEQDISGLRLKRSSD